MSKHRIQNALILMLLVSVICVIGIMSTVQSAITGPVKIMPVGDSVTAGIGSTGNGAYRTDLYKHYTNAGLNIDFVGSQSGGPSSLPDKNHEGHSGWVISQISSNVNNWLNTYNPDVMLLMIGGNDTLQGGVPTSALSSLIDQITNMKPNLYLFVADYYYSLPSTQNYQQIIQYDAAIPGVVQQKANAGKHVYFVKLSDAQLSTSEYADGLHPTDSGYSKLAAIWNRDTTSIIKSLVGGTIPTPTPGSGAISIAAGSSSAVGSFQADQYYSGGSTYSNGNTVDVSQITSNPPPASLFNNERYGAMSYTIPGFTAGNSYEVTLYFAETYLTSSGSRRFNVSINGATALSNFDIYASAGGQNKAIARSFTATANSNGQIVIQFTSVTENPKINGISIKPSGPNPTPTPSSAVTPTGIVNTPTPIPGTISIAAGRSSALGSFQADRYYSGGSTYSNSNTVDVSQITGNPPPAALFNNERYGAMSYTIPGFTAGSVYTVTLYFAETYLTSSGSRLFNVSINGATVLSNFDIYASAGGQNKAIARSFTATAKSSGQIMIQFTAVTQNPKINGISITR